MSQVITKYCTPAARAAMLQGNFRVGTHVVYANSEGGGAMDDKMEGKHRVKFQGDLKIGEISIGKTQLSEFRIKAAPGVAALVVDYPVNFNVFCASVGRYSGEQHRAMLKGSGEYRGNKTYTSHVMLDVERLSRALCVLSADHYPGHKILCVKQRVHYGSRETQIANSIHPISFAMGTDASTQFSVAFSKPERFRLENEFRFCIAPIGFPPTQIVALTSENASVEVKRLFREAIV